MEQLEKESYVNLFQRQAQPFPKWFADLACITKYIFFIKQFQTFIIEYAYSKSYMQIKILRHQRSHKGTNELYPLACGLDCQVSLYQGCMVNGIQIYTKDKDD